MRFAISRKIILKEHILFVKLSKKLLQNVKNTLEPIGYGWILFFHLPRYPVMILTSKLVKGENSKNLFLTIWVIFG